MNIDRALSIRRHNGADRRHFMNCNEGGSALCRLAPKPHTAQQLAVARIRAHRIELRIGLKPWHAGRALRVGFFQPFKRLFRLAQWYVNRRD